MINSKKKGFTNVKGFTIVELVIVIAVIAVLSAVLIPTFSNLVKKANMSADQQAVRQMNTALAIESRPEDIESAVALLDKAGYNAFESLSPVSKGYNFYWIASNNTIVLVDENLKVLFPDNLEGEDLTDDVSKGEAYNLKSGYVIEDLVNEETLLEAIEKGQSVKLVKDIEITKAIYINKEDTIKIDLQGFELKTNTYADGSAIKHTYGFENNGSLTLSNGTISGRGAVNNFGYLVIEETMKIKALDDNGGACVWAREGSTTIINGGYFYAASSQSSTHGASLILNNGGNVTINGGEFVSDSKVYGINHKSGVTTINGNVNVTAARGAVYCEGGELSINDGTFTALADHSGYALAAYGGTINVNGGTYNSASNYDIVVANVDDGTPTNVICNININVTKISSDEDTNDIYVMSN